MDNVKIALDAMGGDNAPEEIVKGAISAVHEKNDISVILVGKEKKIKAELSKYKYDKSRISIVNADEEISCDESPVVAIKKKKNSSMVIALKLVKSGEADAFVSAGSSGAILVGGQLIVGRIKGIERAPLATLLPTANGVSLLLDCGANVDAKPSYLVQFAKMGSLYMQHILGIKNPKVSIVNIGVEEEKGNLLTKETYPILKECKDINFSGSIEPRDVPFGVADVIVCDAFVGNVILKLSEGLSSMLIKTIKKSLMSTLKSKIGALLIKSTLKSTIKTFDASEYGGAPLLGLNGLVVKVHGNAKSKEVKNALIQCYDFKQQNFNEKVKNMLSENMINEVK